MGPDPLVGKKIGNYCIISLINGGAYGNVYKGEHIHLTNRVVAIKFLHTYMVSAEHTQFLQEAQFLSALEYRYILPLIDFGFDGGRPYLIAQYAPGGSLRRRLLRQSPLPMEQALTILSQAGQALQYAHSLRIVHRDLKPENILFNVQGEALLADFGIATLLSNTSVKQSAIIGTPSYMAPEQFRGIVSNESDQYALGCIAYELLTGRRPFTAPDFIALGFKHATESPISPGQLNAQIMPGCEAAILKAMAKQRVDRHVSVEAFLTALRAPFFQPTIVVSSASMRTKEEWLKVGDGHARAGYNEEALAAYDQAIGLDPTYTLAYSNKGIVLTKLERNEEALIACDQAIRLDLAYAAAYVNKGYVLDKLERYDEAFMAYDEAIHLDPTNTVAYHNKGVVLRKLERYDEALMAYNEAIRLDSTYTVAYVSKGYALDKLERNDEALMAYDEAIHLDPTYTVTYHNKGVVLDKLEHYDEALMAYNEAIRLDSTYTVAYVNKGVVLRKLERNDEALMAYDEALRLDSTYTVAYVSKGYALDELERYDEALMAYNEAIHLDPTNTVAYHNKGVVLHKLERYDEALMTYDEAIRLDSTYTVAYINKGYTLDELERYDEALMAYDEAIRLDPTDADAYCNKGNALKHLGRHEEAQQVYEQAKEKGLSL